MSYSLDCTYSSFTTILISKLLLANQAPGMININEDTTFAFRLLKLPSESYELQSTAHLLLAHGERHSY